MTVYVYKITNTVNDKLYFGITKQGLSRRWSLHEFTSKKASHKLANAIKKYGADAFNMSLVAVCENWEAACEMERALIAQHNTYANGYNSTLGGDGRPGQKPSAETLAKMSAAMKGRVHSEETKAKLSKRKTGVPCPEGTRERISASLKGRKMPDQTKAKIAAALKSSAPFKGRALAQETKIKIAAALKGLEQSPETRAKRSLALKGRPRPDHVKAKIAATKKANAAARKLAQSVAERAQE